MLDEVRNKTKLVCLNNIMINTQSMSIVHETLLFTKCRKIDAHKNSETSEEVMNKCTSNLVHFYKLIEKGEVIWI